jgi:hypothetical protein
MDQQRWQAPTSPAPTAPAPPAPAPPANLEQGSRDLNGDVKDLLDGLVVALEPPICPHIMRMSY